MCVRSIRSRTSAMPRKVRRPPIDSYCTEHPPEGLGLLQKFEKAGRSYRLGQSFVLRTVQKQHGCESRSGGRELNPTGWWAVERRHGNKNPATTNINWNRLYHPTCDTVHAAGGDP